MSSPKKTKKALTSSALGGAVDAEASSLDGRVSLEIIVDAASPAASVLTVLVEESVEGFFGGLPAWKHQMKRNAQIERKPPLR